MTETPLPGMPELSPPPAARKSDRRVVARYKGRRRLCDRCVSEIHARGVAVAPYPMPSKWRVTADGDARYLCTRCCEEETP